MKDTDPLRALIPKEERLISAGVRGRWPHIRCYRGRTTETGLAHRKDLAVEIWWWGWQVGLSMWDRVSPVAQRLSGRPLGIRLWSTCQSPGSCFMHRDSVHLVHLLCAWNIGGAQ